MPSILQLGRLERVDLREAWPHEAINFTPWLAIEENLELLGAALGLQLELEGVEQAVESFSADILAKDRDSGGIVLIENQLEQTDHSHLGQILTYAAGLGAETVVWIAKEFREPHRAAIDFLNHISSDVHNFFGVQIELYRIGTSAFAPQFTIVAKPNDWSRRVIAKTTDSPERAAARQEWVEYWGRFFKAADAAGLTLVNRVEPAEGWCRIAQIASGDPSATIWCHWGKKRLRVVLWLQGQSRLELFDQIKAGVDARENLLDHELHWHRMDTKKSSMICLEREQELFENDDDEFDWFIKSTKQLDEQLRELITSILAMAE